jgi:4-amino-4-deoxy-L-arabinose transferase-like glycosyltransferase
MWTTRSILSSLSSQKTFLILSVVFLVKAAVLFAPLQGLNDFVANQYSIGFRDEYDVIANHVAQGFGYRVETYMDPTMIREPAYPLFLALVFRIGGYRLEVARLTALLLTIGIAVMMMRFAKRVTDNRVTALLATLLFLLYPGTIIAEARAGIEIPFIFAIMLFMLAIHRAIDQDTLWRYFVAGLLLGLVVMVRSTPLLFPVCLLAYLVYMAKGARRRVRHVLNIALLGLGMALVMSPWIIRNYVLVHEFVPSASVQGMAAQEGQYTCQHLSFDTTFLKVQQQAGELRTELARQFGMASEGTYYQFFYKAHDEIAFNKKLLQQASAEYRKDPVLFARCVGKNVFNFWFLGKTWRATWLNVFAQLPLLAFAFGGAWSLWKHGLLRNLGIIVMFVLYVFAVHVPIIAHARHSIPLVPFLAMLASVSVVSMWHSVKHRVDANPRWWRRSRAAPALTPFHGEG